MARIEIMGWRLLPCHKVAVAVAVAVKWVMETRLNGETVLVAEDVYDVIMMAMRSIGGRFWEGAPMATRRLSLCGLKGGYGETFSWSTLLWDNDVV